MKIKVVSVETEDKSEGSNLRFIVTKVTQQQAEAPGEKVDPARQKTTVYDGPSNAAAIEARNAAQRLMFEA